MSQKDNNTKKTQCIVGTVVILRLPHGSTEYDNDFLPQRGKGKKKKEKLTNNKLDKQNQSGCRGGRHHIRTPGRVRSARRHLDEDTDVLFSMYCCYLLI